MVVPFADFAIPPILHLALLLAITAIDGALLYTFQPQLTQRTVLAMIPWVIVGALLHVFYQLDQVFLEDLLPGRVEPFLAAPAVYLTTFVCMATVWLVTATVVRQSTAEKHDRVANYLVGIGLGVMLPLLGLLAWQATSPSITPRLVLPIGGLLLSLGVAFVVYILLGAWRTFVLAEARQVGGLVIFAHVFDGITTAIGVDFLGVGERSYVPRQIIDFAADLPTAQYLGSGWLFIVVKTLLASVLVVMFADYISESPRRGNLLFAFLAFVGLGPALNNFFLFMLGI
jgi:uncharacterized membrane protein